jgi:membrane-associated protease RseP (regulator of RpoE activity)
VHLLQALLFVVTVWSASLVGSTFYWSFQHNQPAILLSRDLAMVTANAFDLTRLLPGLWYSGPLLLILTAHEFGHYFACVFYRIRATLPYFLPAPTLIGTLGAFIRIRGAILSRVQLFDVGVAGPIAGFVFLAPVLLVGVSLSKVIPGIAHQGDLVMGSPLLLQWVQGVLFPGVPNQDILLHPMARAALVGMLATALNLLPVGQLDGGHIVYALHPKRQLLIARAFVLLLLPLGLLWEGWWFWAVLLFVFKLRHPPVYDHTPLGKGRKWVAAAALGIFILCFTPTPVLP